ncbi:ceramide kinase-like protein isoform X3 [Acanthochromis polyacanthus]|uniref:ceramide kinase-like protein isoform X3 n=1 Tax=Acanthochromis polyacanthus TaxID=80966 RepID=UPI002234B056|nr:ceramide kinase-like protein isoform X3 [Acanthochromis polyacanthus]
MSEPEEELQEERRDNPKKTKKKKKKKKKEEEEKKKKQDHEEQVEEEEQSECLVLRGIFKLGKKSHDVLLTRTRLTWTPIVPETPTGDASALQTGVILLQDVFAVKVKRRRAAGQQSGGPVLGVTLFYGRRRGRRLEEDTLHLHNASAEHTHTWYNTLKELLTGFSRRPRYVKVFINPSSHKKEAVYIYREHVAPLFKLADVRTDITGHRQQVDMCSFSSLGQLVCFGFSAMFGFGGRSLARAEKKRWMPSSRRREYALVKTLARLRPEDCQLSFLPAKKPNRDLFGHRDQDQDQDLDPEPEGEESWTTNQGLYLSISIMSIPCLSPHTPRGLAPNTSVANGSAALIAVGNTSRSEFIKHLKRYSGSSGQFSFSFVETHCVSAVRIRPRSLTGWAEEESEEEEGDPRTTPIIQAEGQAFPWNIDGELVEIANEVVVRVHPRLITLYGEEVDEAESTVSCSCI